MEKPSVNHNSDSLNRLIDLIETLRGANGCPWDQQQTPKSISIYLIEEVYELVDTILENDLDGICEELGDVLFQLLFIISLNKENFNLAQVIENNISKMVTRHPHVFGDKKIKTAGQVKKQWEALKKAEKQNMPQESILESVPSGLPALVRAYRISERAAGTGFDWDNLAGVTQKVLEEWEEFQAELRKDGQSNGNKKNISLEFGDLLFTMVNVARFAGIHPETALAEATRKFEKRFKYMEKSINQNDRKIDMVSRSELNRLWLTAKKNVSD